MRWEETNNQVCSIARSLPVFGDRWTLLVLRQVFMKVRRFSDIQTTLGITKHRLSDRLNRLIEDGILYKEMYDEAHKRFEYKLTEKGLDIYPIIIAIAQWGDKWLADEDGIPIEYLHGSCNHVTAPKLMCSYCGEEMHAKNTQAIPGPGILKKLEAGSFTKADIDTYKHAFRK